MSLRLVLARDLSGADIATAFDEALGPRLERRQGAAGTPPRQHRAAAHSRLFRQGPAWQGCRDPVLLPPPRRS